MATGDLHDLHEWCGRGEGNGRAWWCEGIVRGDDEQERHLGARQVVDGAEGFE